MLAEKSNASFSFRKTPVPPSISPVPLFLSYSLGTARTPQDAPAAFARNSHVHKHIANRFLPLRNSAQGISGNLHQAFGYCFADQSPCISGLSRLRVSSGEFSVITTNWYVFICRSLDALRSLLYLKKRRDTVAERRIPIGQSIEYPGS